MTRKIDQRVLYLQHLPRPRLVTTYAQIGTSYFISSQESPMH